MRLVTGGSGYFGSYLLSFLAKKQKDLRCFDLYDSADRQADVDFVQGDIRDPQALKLALEGVDTVYHNVAMVPLAKDKKAFWSVNYEGSKNLFQSCLQAGVRKVIHMSSSAVFGVPESNPVTESQIPHPAESYGQSKLAAESLCRQFVEAGLDITIIRPRTIMGHGRLGIMQILFEWIFQGRPVPVFGKGDNLYQFVHAQDLAEACFKASSKSGPGLYHVGTDRFGSMRDTLEALIAHAGTDSKLVSLPAKPAEALMNATSAAGWSPLGAYHALMYGRSMYFDLSHTQEELDWTPHYSNIEMFLESYDWYVAHRQSLLSTPAVSHHRGPVKQGILSLVSAGLALFPPLPSERHTVSR